MGTEWWTYANEIVKTDQLTLAGTSTREDDNIAAMKIYDHDSKMTKFIFEFHVKQITDPSLSKIAMSIYNNKDFIPSLNSEMMLLASNSDIKVIKDVKYNNFMMVAPNSLIFEPYAQNLILL